jgi:hypothetical protein
MLARDQIGNGEACRCRAGNRKIAHAENRGEVATADEVDLTKKVLAALKRAPDRSQDRARIVF